MSCISQEEKLCLYEGVRHELGAPIRKIELTDEMLDTYLKFSIEDYAEICAKLVDRTPMVLVNW